MYLYKVLQKAWRVVEFHSASSNVWRIPEDTKDCAVVLSKEYPHYFIELNFNLSKTNFVGHLFCLTDTDHHTELGKYYLPLDQITGVLEDDARLFEASIISAFDKANRKYVSIKMRLKNER